MTTYTTFGPVDPRARQQLEICAGAGRADYAVLCADHHLGYSMPIGGVVAYPDMVSPSGVGFDIGCGVTAVRTGLRAADVRVPEVMDEITNAISFGIGRRNRETVSRPVLQDIADAPFAPQRGLLGLAEAQLGTVGAGNHYVDVLEDEDGFVWVATHFGSRGFGHRTASGFLALAQGLSFFDRGREAEPMSPPALFPADSELGQAYLSAMALAGEYARTGRQWVVWRALGILHTGPTLWVNNHHNYAWRESHFGRDYYVVRKGATPAFPGQQGFVGGSMGDLAVVVEGADSDLSRLALYSTVHGAGRVMSRTQAAGKWTKRNGVRARAGGAVDWELVRHRLALRGIAVRGGAADEAPEVYRSLRDVVDAHSGTIRIVHTLRPVGVAMAGPDVSDPYKD